MQLLQPAPGHFSRRHRNLHSVGCPLVSRHCARHSTPSRPPSPGAWGHLTSQALTGWVDLFGSPLAPPIPGGRGSSITGRGSCSCLPWPSCALVAPLALPSTPGQATGGGALSSAATVALLAGAAPGLSMPSSGEGFVALLAAVPAAATAAPGLLPTAPLPSPSDPSAPSLSLWGHGPALWRKAAAFARYFSLSQVGHAGCPWGITGSMMTSFTNCPRAQLPLAAWCCDPFAQ